MTTRRRPTSYRRTRGYGVEMSAPDGRDIPYAPVAHTTADLGVFLQPCQTSSDLSDWGRKRPTVDPPAEFVQRRRLVCRCRTYVAPPRTDLVHPVRRRFGPERVAPNGRAAHSRRGTVLPEGLEGSAYGRHPRRSTGAGTAGRSRYDRVGTGSVGLGARPSCRPGTCQRRPSLDPATSRPVASRSTGEPSLGRGSRPGRMSDVVGHCRTGRAGGCRGTSTVRRPVRQDCRCRPPCRTASDQ